MTGASATVADLVTWATELHALVLPAASIERTCQYQTPGVIALKYIEVLVIIPEEYTPVVRDHVPSTVDVIDVFTSYVRGPVPTEGFQE